MRYEYMTGLPERKIDELVRIIQTILDEQGHLPATTGRRPVLDLKGKIWITLALLRHNLTEQAVGDQVGLSQQRISEIKTWTEPLIAQALESIQIPLDQAVKNRVTVVDGTYVPTGNRKQTGRTNYSGKRGCQCVSVQVACTLQGRLLAVSDPVPGARHDQAALELCGWQAALQEADWIADSAYIASGALTPIKRKPGIGLYESQKQFNHDLSSIRYVIEQCIAHLKNWKILAKGYRRQLKHLPAIITLVANLQLYKLSL